VRVPNIVVPKVTLAELNSEQSVNRHEAVLFQINFGGRQENDWRSMCLLLFAENQRLKEQFERRRILAEVLLLPLLPITLLSLFSFHVAVPLAIGWVVIACCVYVVSLVAENRNLPEAGRIRGVLVSVLEDFDIRLQRFVSRLRD
jgi:hypothetical protein